MKSRRNSQRISALSVALVLAGVGMTACGSDEPGADPVDSAVTSTVDEASDETGAGEDGDETGAGEDGEESGVEPRVVSAEEGVAARGRQAQFGAVSDGRVGAEAASADSTMVADECGVYEPTQEDIDAANAESEALAAELDRFGIVYERSTDDFGYVMITYDYEDVVAQSVVDSYWSVRYPAEPIPQEELDAVRANNDVIAAALDDAGVAYTRTTDDSGWESIEYDYEDPAAQAAVDAAWLVIYPPEPPSPEVLAQQDEYNTELMAAFDAAGIQYQLVQDELGWAWVEWDYEDPAIGEQVAAVFDELYPPISVDPIIDCIAVDPLVEEVAVEEVAVEEVAVEEVAVEEVAVDPAEELTIEPAPIDRGFSDEQIAARDAEVAALAAGFEAAGVTAELVGESPWQTVVFDSANEASVAVVASVLAARG
ncbi:MAG: hypothetical protein ACE37B_15510 [Ilumatobacter sp.]|uniref:hypothetical protein n=1 Tax=Ilumatobacter sp. TaxID=1967498 RepID=UPI00391C0730